MEEGDCETAADNDAGQRRRVVGGCWAGGGVTVRQRGRAVVLCGRFRRSGLCAPVKGLLRGWEPTWAASVVRATTTRAAGSRAAVGDGQEGAAVVVVSVWEDAP